RGLLLVRRPDLQRLNITAKRSPLLTLVQQAIARKFSQIGQSKVASQRLPKDKALPFAILGQQTDPRTNGVAWISNLQLLPIELNRPTFGLVRAKDQAHRFGPTRTNQSSEPDNFTRAHGEG